MTTVGASQIVYGHATASLNDRNCVVLAVDGLLGAGAMIHFGRYGQQIVVLASNVHVTRVATHQVSLVLEYLLETVELVRGQNAFEQHIGGRGHVDGRTPIVALQVLGHV